MIKKRKIDGFSLIELMISIAIVGIVASVAVPSYTDHVESSRRAEAVSAVFSIANAQERFFTINNSYTNSLASLGSSNFSESGLYGLAVVIGVGSTTYTISATPGPDWNDPDCNVFSLTNTGLKGVNGDYDKDNIDGDLDDVDGCWR